MKLRIAVFDPSTSRDTGDYWIWRHDQIQRSVLDKCYREIQPHLPSDPNKLQEEDFFGGIVFLPDNVCCIYRVFNGGRDPRGRPGRFVILIGITSKSEILGWPCQALLESDALNPWRSVQAIPCPPPCPSSLEAVVAPVRQTTNPQPRPVIIADSTAMQQSWDAVWDSLSTSAAGISHWTFRRLNGQRTAERVQIRPEATISNIRPQAPQVQGRLHENMWVNGTIQNPPKVRGLKVIVMILVGISIGDMWSLYQQGFFSGSERSQQSTVIRKDGSVMRAAVRKTFKRTGQDTLTPPAVTTRKPKAVSPSSHAAPSSKSRSTSTDPSIEEKSRVGP